MICHVFFPSLIQMGNTLTGQLDHGYLIISAPKDGWVIWVYLVVGKTICGAPLKLILTVIIQTGIGAMTIAPTQRQISIMHMKALKYIGHMKKNQKLFVIKNVSMYIHIATNFC